MAALRTWVLHSAAPSTTLSFALPHPLLHFRTKPYSSFLHTRRYTLAALAPTQTPLDAPAAAGGDSHSQSVHPWPEWVAFVDRLKAHGYFPQTASVVDAELVYREMNVVKEPCLSFARDRYDLFGSLSRGDIQAIVEGGCPKVLRKVVNSAKRLRVYVGLDESAVCSMCSLRGSCDRAHVTLKESEQDARTVDLVRLLLFYALDPMVISGAVGSEQVDQANSSARTLLRLLTELSESSPTPVIPSKNSVVPPARLPVKDSYQKKHVVPPARLPVKDSYQKKHVSRLNNDLVAHNSEMKKGDWVCPECNFMNFSRNVRCRKCDAENPKDESARPVEMKAGDWNCPQCGCMNFASRRNCFKCKESRPPRNLNPGEWECPKCDFVNFRRNANCLKCGTVRIGEAGSVSHYEEQFWRRPE